MIRKIFFPLSILFKSCFLFAILVSSLTWFSLPVQAAEPTPTVARVPTIVLTLFWGDGCPHCHEEIAMLTEYVKTHPNLEIRTYELWKQPANLPIVNKVATYLGFEFAGVPLTFLGTKKWSGYNDITATEIRNQLDLCLAIGCPDAMAKILTKEEIAQAVPFTEIAAEKGFWQTTNGLLVIFVVVIGALGLLFFFGFKKNDSPKKSKKTNQKKRSNEKERKHG